MIVGGLRFPFAISKRGVAASSIRAQQIKEQLEQLLFTLPGERVLRPSFGCGVQRLVFAGLSEDTMAAAEYTISTAIRDYLGEVLLLEAVRVSSIDTKMTIDILYTLLETGEELSASFEQPIQDSV